MNQKLTTRQRTVLEMLHDYGAKDAKFLGVRQDVLWRLKLNELGFIGIGFSGKASITLKGKEAIAE